MCRAAPQVSLSKRRVRRTSLPQNGTSSLAFNVHALAHPAFAAAGACICAAAALATIRHIIPARFRRRVQLGWLRFFRYGVEKERIRSPAVQPSVQKPSVQDTKALVPLVESGQMEYARLPAVQRRALLEDALASAFEKPIPKPVKKPVEVVEKVVKPEWDKATMFWKMAESANGRAAALGFVLCLMREVLEPGHPSLFEQVVDVVVPIAQSTPPFLVAVVDRIADLLT